MYGYGHITIWHCAAHCGLVCRVAGNCRARYIVVGASIYSFGVGWWGYKHSIVRSNIFDRQSVSSSHIREINCRDTLIRNSGVLYLVVAIQRISCRCCRRTYSLGTWGKVQSARSIFILTGSNNNFGICSVFYNSSIFHDGVAAGVYPISHRHNLTGSA